MKTAMQQLLEYIEATINNDPINDLGVGQSMALKLMKSRIKNEWLEAEKEQIINFHIEVMKEGLIEEGDEKLSDAYLPKIREAAEKYYTKTFKSDE